MVAAAVLQTTLGPLVGVLGAAPDLVLILVVCWALVKGSTEGLLLGVLGGLLLGLLSAAPLGMHALVLAITGYFAGAVSFSPLRSRVVIPALAMAASTVLYDLLTGFILRLAGWPLPDLRTLADVIVPTVVTNALVAPLIYWPIVRIIETREGLHPEF